MNISYRFIVALSCLVLLSQAAAQVRVVQTQTVIEGYNRVADQKPVDNFELEFYGNVSSTDVQDIFMGPDHWGTPARICNYSGTTGMDITWFDRVHPLNSGESKSMGVDLVQPTGDLGTQIPDINVLAYWTRIEKEIVPFPLLSVSLWSVETELPITFYFNEDLLSVLTAYLDSVQYAFLDTPLSLSELKWNSNISTTPVTLTEHKVNNFPSITLPGVASTKYLVLQYLLSQSNLLTSPYAYVSFQLHIDTDPFGNYIIKKFDINVDVLNNSGEAKDNFEFDWIGYARKEDIKDYYKGSQAWGNPPRIQEFEYGSLPPLVTDPSEFEDPNILGGLELTWMDKCNPLANNAWAHFGFSTGVGVEFGKMFNYPNVFYFLMYWTKVVKVEDVPVPWQWWQSSYTNPTVRDIMQLGSLYTGSAYVQREYAVLDRPLPLDSLRFNPNITSNWTQVDASRQAIAPNGTLQVDVPVTGKMYGAVLVRTSVYASNSSQGPEAQIISQAEFYDPKTTGVDLNLDRVPDEFMLSRNFPNPFNMNTNIQIGLPQSNFLELNIYNVCGQKVRSLHAGGLPAGTHTFLWNGRDDQGRILPSGLYFARYQVRDYTKTVKMQLMK